MVFGEWGSFRRYSCISAWTCLAHPTVGGQRSGGRDSSLVIIETENNLNIHSTTEYANSLLCVTTHLSVLSSSLFSLWLIFQNLLSENKGFSCLVFATKQSPYVLCRNSQTKNRAHDSQSHQIPPSVSKNTFLTGSLNTSVQQHSHQILWSMGASWHYQFSSFGGCFEIMTDCHNTYVSPVCWSCISASGEVCQFEFRGSTVFCAHWVPGSLCQLSEHQWGPVGNVAQHPPGSAREQHGPQRGTTC